MFRYQFPWLRLKPIPRIEVTDFIEMGRLVAEWNKPETRPANIAELGTSSTGSPVVP